MPDYVLGLDLGPNSCGWAVVEARVSMEGERATHEPLGFLDTSSACHPPLGVRVFEAGLDNFDSSKERSKCDQRRTARSMRRTHQRRNARRAAVRRLLTSAGLYPPNAPEREALSRLDPYMLRAKGLDEPLAPHELGRAIYHLAQRRGFKSNRKSGEPKEDGKVLGAIGELERAINESGSRTLGEHLFRLAASNGSGAAEAVKLRGRHTRRDMYRSEFEALVTVQRAHHAELLREEVVTAIERAIFDQRSFAIDEERRRRAPSRANLHRAPSLRACPLEPDHRRASIGTWEAQRFRILKQVGDLKVSNYFAADKALNMDERALVIERLSVSKTVTFDSLRKLLAKQGGDPEARFNLERGKRRHLAGNAVDAVLVGAVGRKKWDELDDATRVELRAALMNAEDSSALIERLCSVGATRAKAESAAGWRPPDQHLAYSAKALARLLPHLEAGMTECQAIEQAYPDRPASRVFSALPPLNSPELPVEIRDITNPVVRRCLGETRKVVNALVRHHGLPARIVVELARDAKAGPEERKRWSSTRDANEREREEARAAVASLGGNPHSRSDVNRYLFWREQQGACPYTGECIPQAELFGGEWDVDHILPRHKSGDDSFANKVLVRRAANQEKGDRTPAEWLGEDSDRFRHMVQRAEAMSKHAGGLSRSKLERLRQPHVDAEGFIARQLNDTRYITKMVMKYLSLLYPAAERVGERRVQSSRGSLTAELRRQWGLNGVLDPLLDAEGEPIFDEDSSAGEKSRADHRHHAVDAVVVALSSRATLKTYQNYRKSRELRGLESAHPELAPPILGLRDLVADHVSRINVSHRVMRKVSNALHEETFRGQLSENGSVVVGEYTSRKRLDGEFTPKMLSGVRDTAIRRILEDHARARGWSGTGTFPKGCWEDPAPATASGTPIRRVRLRSSKKRVVSLGHRFAVPGANHHLVVWHNTTACRWLAEVFTCWEVAQRVRREGRAPVDRTSGEGLKFVMSLARKESLMLRLPGSDDPVLCVVQNLSQDAPVGSGPLRGMELLVRDARDARPASASKPILRLKSFVHWEALAPEKVQVDPLGRVAPAGD